MFMKILVSKEELSKVDEKILLLAVLGMLRALEGNCITINEAEKFLLSPGMADILKEQKCNEKIVHIIEKGCELEDVDSLIPEKLGEVVKELIDDTLNILNGYKEFDKSRWFELEYE